MIPRIVSRRLRPLWLAAAATAAWANRDDLRRWAGFARRTLTERANRPMSEVMTEARVRATISADPLLRRDPSLEDLTVRDGVVTLRTATPVWPNSASRIRRLERVKGISSVTWNSTPLEGADGLA